MLLAGAKARFRNAAASVGQFQSVRLLTLPRDDQRLLLGVLPVVLFVRLALWLVPLSRLHRLLITRRVGMAAPLSTGRAHRLAWAVTAVGRRIPGATCLTRALALQVLLRGRGNLSKLHVGFVVDGAGGVRGHAWLEWQDEVLIGGGEHSAFRTLVTLYG